MNTDYVKRFLTKDGNTRITIYQDEYAENPRDMTDEPLHCEDWNRDWSIMNKREKETKSPSARTFLEYMLENYGNYKKIIDALVENGKHMTDGKSVCNNALVYDKSLHGWALREYTKWFGEKEYNWKDASFFYGKKNDIDLYTLLDVVLDGTIDYIAKNCMTDNVKMASYGFGYYGDISFYHEFSTDSEGICWLEKDEFLKYSGCKEEDWKEKSLDEIEYLLDELEAWGDNEVYGFVVEKKHRFKLHKEYIDEDKEDEDTEDEEWEETDSCWGFYGELNKSLEWILESAGYKIEELDEVA